MDEQELISRSKNGDVECFNLLVEQYQRMVYNLSWEDDATLLAVKCGVSWNHAHADAGSFILFHGGKPLLIDSGTCSYSRPEYSSYYRQSQAHNLILFNGQGQNREDVGYADRGVSIPGRIHEGLDAPGVKYVQADATGPPARNFSRHYRHFVWLDSAILVIDDVRSHEPGQFEWLLHYEGNARTEGDRLFLANGDRSRAMVHWLFPEQMTEFNPYGYPMFRDLRIHFQNLFL